MTSGQNERRRHPRYSCDVGVQIREQKATGGGYWGTLADISMSGCYVYTFSPLSRGTAVLLQIKAGDAVLAVSGNVVTSHPGVGMGVEFTGFPQADGAKHLKDMIASLESQAAKHG
jgi:PilZ domain